MTPREQNQPADGPIERDGESWLVIDDLDAMEPFFMTVASASDVWLFLSSSGGLTAGRRNPDHALFPYFSDDKIVDQSASTGSLTRIRLVTTDTADTADTTDPADPADPTDAADPAASLWRPFADPAQGRRRILKSPEGDSVVLEESHPFLGLTLRVRWTTSRRFGLVRACQLLNEGDEPCTVELLDGVQNLLPAGVTRTVQNELSNLLNAYKRAEIDPETGLGLITLSSRLTDLAEPSESLSATVAWGYGLPSQTRLASTRQVRAFERGEPIEAERDVRGQRGAYLTHATLTLPPHGRHAWWLVCDTDRDCAQVADLQESLRHPDALLEALQDDLADGRAQLRRILAAGDGLQLTGDWASGVHHMANVLFNSMRGGTPRDGYRVEGADVRAFIAERNKAVAERVPDCPESLTTSELIAWGRSSGDPDLERLTLEYLPLTFSRRHGDPTRPWNVFDIRVADDQGRPILGYQGNWRDIFQNWEALAQSFPELLESMIAVFVDATTADGYNPYRISRVGIDWEVPEPDNPWANIGYWSDHQIIYLLRLLEASADAHPGRLHDLFGRRIFTHADVPYRIKGLDDLLRDARSSITFDESAHAAVLARAARIGGDGRLVHSSGDIVRVSLAEKLLTLLAAKLVNFVPEGGIWMNTQRPEWNDANNALAGPGLSVVTLSYLRRYVRWLGTMLVEIGVETGAETGVVSSAETGAVSGVEIGVELAELLSDVHRLLRSAAGALSGPMKDGDRFDFLVTAGRAGERFRAKIYAGASGATTELPASQIQALLTDCLTWLDHSLRANRRDDGLFHAYNVLRLTDNTAGVEHLTVMLEGQVAVLSSGLLEPEEAVALLDALRASALFRGDQHSYLLYPDRDLPGFLAKNKIPDAVGQYSPDLHPTTHNIGLFESLIERGDRRLVVADVRGDRHFAADLRNASVLVGVLDEMAAEPQLADAVARDRDAVMQCYEDVFHHRSYTGRSGSFFAYEGLGSIYWHMVSKLLLAVQETWHAAALAGADASVVAAIAARYEDVRSGLGASKIAAIYGAFPTDPYSHTPAGAGARQPGMTGMVKEEVLTRLGEIGLDMRQGCLVADPSVLRPEWLGEAARFRFVDVDGSDQTLDAPPGTMAATFCGVPVLVTRGPSTSLTATLADGSRCEGSDGRLSLELSASVFGRTGEVRLLEVTLA